MHSNRSASTPVTMACVLGLGAVAVIGSQQQRPGYDDTPFQPDGAWRIHDSRRPVPPVVKPGAFVSLPPPADAVVLLGPGSDLSAWQMTDGKPARWAIADNVLQSGKGSIRTTSPSEPRVSPPTARSPRPPWSPSFTTVCSCTTRERSGGPRSTRRSSRTCRPTPAGPFDSRTTPTRCASGTSGCESCNGQREAGCQLRHARTGGEAPPGATVGLERGEVVHGTNLPAVDLAGRRIEHEEAGLP